MGSLIVLTAVGISSLVKEVRDRRHKRKAEKSGEVFDSGSNNLGISDSKCKGFFNHPNPHYELFDF
jgi:hypothetical protein